MSIMISLAAEFVGKKAFKDADKNISALEKGAKKLGKTLAGVFAADKVIAFGKASVKAFEEDQKSAAMLANTMKNLGLEFASPVLENYITSLSKTAAVADDELRPAMQKLLTQTGNYAKAQEILNQAIEVSRGSGVELSTVTQDLANAYVGNTKGLKKYNLGLSQAELKTMSFTELQKKLAAQFKGSNAAYLETYAGQMQVLTVAAGEAQETIGKGLMDSLALIAGDGSVKSLADSMQSVADNTSAAIYEIGILITELKKLGMATPSWVKSLLGLSYKITFPGLGAIKNIIKEGEKAQNSKLQNPSVQMFMTDQANQRLNNQKLKTQKEQTKAIKTQTAELKKQAATKKQSALFDIEKIGIVAALQGKISDEEKLRLNLQMALLTGNDKLAADLAGKLADSIDSTGKLKTWLATLPDANNPFKGWDTWLTGFTDRLKATLALASGNTSIPVTPPSTNIAGFNVNQGATTTGVGSTANGDIIINIAGSVTSEEDLVAKIRAGIQSGSLSGKKSDIGRLAGMFG